MSGASERANGRASGPVFQSVFLAVINHSGRVRKKACIYGVKASKEICRADVSLLVSPFTNAKNELENWKILTKSSAGDKVVK